MTGIATLDQFPLDGQMTVSGMVQTFRPFLDLVWLKKDFLFCGKGTSPYITFDISSVLLELLSFVLPLSPHPPCHACRGSASVKSAHLSSYSRWRKHHSQQQVYLLGAAPSHSSRVSRFKSFIVPQGEIYNAPTASVRREN